MLDYLGQAVPLGKLAAKGTSEDAAFVSRVEDIRVFATTELGLSESKNYTRYVDLRNADGTPKTYLAAVVSASAADSFTTHEWWFPVVGRMPYKGFFNTADAYKERARLEKKGLDVWIRGVDAFSTLGWFRDPLYSYMKDYSARGLADLIIHELFHATVFIKNEVQFNEQLAEFVGSRGAELYIESRFGKETAHGDEEDAAASHADQAAFLAFVRGLTAELDAVYGDASLTREEKLARKQSVIAAAKERFAAAYDETFATENYRGVSELPINNAWLELYDLYYEKDTFLDDLYARSRSDLPAFIRAAKEMSASLEKGADPKAALEEVLISGS
jgi:predicted aminopeptidase